MKRLIYVMIVLTFISACQKEVVLNPDTHNFTSVEETVVEHVNIPLTDEQLKELFSTVVPIYPATRSDVYNNIDFQEVLNRNGLVVIMFGASWCGPCKIYFPIFVNYAVDCKYTDVAFAYYDVEANVELTEEYEVRSLPTTMFIKNRNLIERRTEILDYNTLHDLVVEHR